MQFDYRMVTREVLPPLAPTELDDLTFKKKARGPNKIHLGGFVVEPGSGDQDNGSLEDQNSNNNVVKRPIMHRMWKYLKHTLTGALAGNGKQNVSFEIAKLTIFWTF